MTKRCRTGRNGHGGLARWSPRKCLRRRAWFGPCRPLSAERETLERERKGFWRGNLGKKGREEEKNEGLAIWSGSSRVE